MSDSSSTKALNVKERIVLLSMLTAHRGSVVEMKVVRDLTDRIGFSDEELQAIGYRVDEESGRATWSDEIREREFEFGGTALGIIRRSLEQLDEKGSMSLDHLSLYEKFVGGEGD